MKYAPLSLWVLYDDTTSDYRGEFIARRFELDHPTSDVRRGASIDDVVAQLPAGLVFLPRDPSDDPCIVGTFL